MSQTVVITGATSGIGYATALAFAALGANIAISGRPSDRGEQAPDEIEAAGGKAYFKTMDVQRSEGPREL